MSLTADPPAGTVPAAGGVLTHNLVNGGGERLVFKVKSSNNTEYRVKPVYGFVIPGTATPLEITRLAGPPKEDKMVVHFAPAPPDATDPQAAFAALQPAGTVTIPLTATEMQQG
ncbi:MSP domain protein [Ancylostoma ceylanicum]|uniref:MSP domain protein n=1 Tax=Ancylostoma ceylanicum TaxID=53326 RepID=A0A0D6M9V8_9BILA|nr:MSP domain protein [Ancylostoma ceylanicum]